MRSDKKYDEIRALHTEKRWVQKAYGTKLTPFDLKLDQLNTDEMVHSLGKQCRYNGDTLKFYSVAQHSVNVSILAEELAVEPEFINDLLLESDDMLVKDWVRLNAQWGLIHDAGEYIFGDMPKPIKDAFPIIKLFEDYLLEGVAEKWGLPWPQPAPVTTADCAMLFVEKDRYLVPTNHEWSYPRPDVKVDLDKLELGFMGPEQAEELFLTRYEEVFT